MGYLDGFKVTFRKLFEPRLTRNYHKDKGGKSDKVPRLHGRHVLNRYEDGMEKCIGCELCAGICPARCIYVRGADNPPDDPVAPGERYGYIYEINYLRCIHCDLCVEACPTEAITESKLFEFSFTNRQDAIYTKAELVVGDDGRPQQLPWEDWTDLEKVEAYTSAWMRATSPSGAAEHEGIVAWAGELGYGVRPAEQGQRAAEDRGEQGQRGASPAGLADRGERQGAAPPMVEGRDERAPAPEAGTGQPPRLQGAPGPEDLPPGEQHEPPPGTRESRASESREARDSGEPGGEPPSLPADNPGEDDT